ncbi:MAG: class I SAM-dependent methyltransferase [Tropicimonas sp.]|uniref:class I SAM-dependent methyltransferase n=1 Tax=Tropicimonas sp. TaxID=2067044 RepID=UPI003A860035
MTPLARILLARIDATGPITLAEFMAECLLHPEHGYYTGETVFGRQGDFTTAPEISQMFGELLGLALAQCWLDQGAPQGATLAEAGPGRGTLMADMLRAQGKVPGLPGALSPHLIEASPRLREVQRAALAGQPSRWLERVDDLPEAPLFFVANEFIDALPIRQFRREGAGWSECMVRRAGEGLGLAFTPPEPRPELAHRLADTAPGSIVEFRPALPALIAALAGRVSRHGGVALLIDYGDWRSRGDTFQALRDHTPCDPLATPGTADLTAHVDFEAIARLATRAGAVVTAMVPQGTFLEHLGITQRAQSLARVMPDNAALENHIAAHRRLTHPQEMGSLFKVIAFHPRGSTPPPGFEP